MLDELRQQATDSTQVKVERARYPEGTTPEPPLLLFDCGSFAWAESHFPDLRVQTHLEILKAIGASGAVLGSTELNLEEDDAQAVFTDPPIPLASCNATLKLDGAQLQPYLTLCPGWYVVGVTAYEAVPGAVPHGWWQLSDPLESVNAVLPTLPEDARVIISAVGQPPAVVAGLAALPVDVVIGNAAGQAPRNGATVLPPPVTRLTTLTLAQFAQDERVPRVWSVELTEDFADAPVVKDLLAAEQTAIHDRLNQAKQARKDGWKDNRFTMNNDFLPQEKPVYDYAGADACAACHPGPYQAWLKSRHCQALTSLVEDGEQQTLDCLQCHTVALLKEDGYDPLEPRAAVGAVSCESCHGPGRLHTEAMLQGEPPADGNLLITRGTIHDCLSCHDDFNSPSFNADTFWEMIKH